MPTTPIFRKLLNPGSINTTGNAAPIDMSKVRAAESATYPCHVCRQKRKAQHIKVRRSDISLPYGAPDGMLILNISYCSDNETCAEMAKNDRDIIKRYIKGLVNDDERNTTASS